MMKNLKDVCACAKGIVLMLVLCLFTLMPLLITKVQAAPPPGWRVETVTPTGRAAWETSIAVDSYDNPHIGYHGGYYSMMYVRFDGTAWLTPERVPDTYYVGRQCSIALDSSDRPHLSYRSQEDECLKYAKKTDTGWEVQIADDASRFAAYGTSIALDSRDRPHIAHYDAYTSDLKHAWWDGATWRQEFVDRSGDVGLHPSIALGPDDSVHISYHDNTNGDLKYAVKTPKSGWSVGAVDTPGDVGTHSSIALEVEGGKPPTYWPHISYYNSTGGDLKYARLVPWPLPPYQRWVRETVDSDSYRNVGLYTSLALDSDNYPHISYYHEYYTNLKYVRKTATGWTTPLTIDDAGYVGRCTSIALDSNDNPHISYFDETNYALKYATTASPNQPPVADANGPYMGTEGEPVAFDGSGSYDPDGTLVSYEWDFGDGNTGSGVSPTHSYVEAGTYTVTLTVTDNRGVTVTDTTTATISEPPNQPPVAEADGTYAGIVGEPVAFDGSGSYDPDGTLVSYEWDFGDGTTGTGVTSTHTYAEDGIYTVTLTVTDDDGATDTDTTQVTIVVRVPAYLVVRGTDNRIYYRAHESSWGDWNVVPRGRTGASPGAAVCAGNLYMVVQGTNGRSLYFGWISLADNSFTGWTRLSGATESAPTLVSYDDTLVLVVRGVNNRVYYCSYDCGSDVWGDWATLPTGTTCDSPAATVMGGELHVVVRGMDGQSLWHGYLDVSTSAFTGWQRIGGATESKPALTHFGLDPDAFLLLDVRGLNNRIYHSVWFGGEWEGWVVLPTGTTCDSPATTIIGYEMHFVVRDTSGAALWHCHIDFMTDTISDWTRIDGSTPSAPTLAN